MRISFQRANLLADWWWWWFAQNSPSKASNKQYLNCELPDVQVGFRKGRGTRDKIANIRWIIEKNKRIPEKHLLMLY